MILFEKKYQQPFAKANITISSNKATIMLSTPGLKKDQVTLTLDNKTLVICGKVDKNREPSTFLLNEFNPITFKRSFEISEDFDTENIEASLKNGIISISIPKKEKTNQFKQISIQ